VSAEVAGKLALVAEYLEGRGAHVVSMDVWNTDRQTDRQTDTHAHTHAHTHTARKWYRWMFGIYLVGIVAQNSLDA